MSIPEFIIRLLYNVPLYDPPKYINRYINIPYSNNSNNINNKKELMSSEALHNEAQNVLKLHSII